MGVIRVKRILHACVMPYQMIVNILVVGFTCQKPITSIRSTQIMNCLLQFIQIQLNLRIMIFVNLTLTFVPVKVTLLCCGDLQFSTLLLHLLNLTLSLPTTKDQCLIC